MLGEKVVEGVVIRVEIDKVKRVVEGLRLVEELVAGIVGVGRVLISLRLSLMLGLW